MPAITVEDTLVLPRLSPPDAASRPRPVAKLVTANRQAEGGGFVVARPFPGELALTKADPFLLLDHVGPQVNGPGEAKGAPWHPHRGIETVSYILEQAAARGAVFTPEQVHAVVETQLAYLRAIGAVGTKADDFDDE